LSTDSTLKHHVWVYNICGNEDYDPKVTGCTHGAENETCLKIHNYIEQIYKEDRTMIRFHKTMHNYTLISDYDYIHLAQSYEEVLK